MRNFPQSLLILTTLACAPEALGVCPNIQRAFGYKMKEYRAYREENLKAYNLLIGREGFCKSTGAEVSASVANAAEAQSCEAQADASRMNAKLEVLGGDCEGNFARLHGLQLKLKAAFVEVQDDLEAALTFMEGSQALRKACPAELQLGRKMVQAFLKLESDIVIVETRSLAGKTDYGKFKEAALGLKTLTAATNRNCGSQQLATGKDSAGPAPVAATRGLGSVAVPKGLSRRPASDISGTGKAIHNAAAGKQVAEAKK